ncbi:MAG: hypothetical protein HZB81_00720 [Deltaproteobacteria bacterium]|nr:hypothetical protein [Deltaproteobacteria bacterium]
MPTQIFQLKEAVLKEMPKGELPWQVFGRLQLKTGFLWLQIKEDTEVTPAQFDTALVAVEEIFGKRFTI